MPQHTRETAALRVKDVPQGLLRLYAWRHNITIYLSSCNSEVGTHNREVFLHVCSPCLIGTHNRPVFSVTPLPAALQNHPSTPFYILPSSNQDPRQPQLLSHPRPITHGPTTLYQKRLNHSIIFFEAKINPRDASHKTARVRQSAVRHLISYPSSLSPIQL